MNDKPYIVEWIGARIDLRKVGREYRGHCPFHSDKHPSLRVNSEKGLWFCDPCGEGGDVFDFIMRLDGLTFPQAKAALGIESERTLRPPLTASRKRAAELAATWANEQQQEIRMLLDDAYEQRDFADESGAFDLGEIFDREVSLLRGFYDALQYPSGCVELLSLKHSIEQLTADVDIVHDMPAPVPPLTPEYVAMVAKNSLDFSRCFR